MSTQYDRSEEKTVVAEPAPSILLENPLAAPPPLHATVAPADSDRAAPLAIGSFLKQRFRLEAELGCGGMGIVYKALDLRRQEARDRELYVALKVISPHLVGDSNLMIALQRESKRAQNLPHPNVITVYDFDRDGPHVYLTMEYLEGKTLAEIIRERPQGLSLAEAWPWILAMGDALGFAHSRGIVHSDFKPANVFITRQNVVKVMDFGLASIATRNQTPEFTVLDGRTLGGYTPAYASLETLEGEPADPSDDVYAFACTVYEMLNGKHPYARLSAVQAREMGAQPKPSKGLGSRQWRALQRGLALTRAERYRTVAALLEDLKPQESRLGRWLVSGGLLLSVLVGAAVWLLRTPDSVEPDTAAVPEQESRVETPPPKILLSKPPAPDLGTPGEQPSDHPILSRLTLEALGEFQGLSPDQTVAVGLNRQKFHLGDTMTLRFAASRSAYIYLIYRNSKGEVVQLYPNRYAPDMEHEKDRIYTVPQENSHDFALRIGKPIGRDRIFVIASNQALAEVPGQVQERYGQLLETAGVSVAEISIEVVP